MLVLTRRPQEVLHISIGDKKVDVKILSVQGNQVRLGIDADRDVSILRDNARKDRYNVSCST